MIIEMYILIQCLILILMFLGWKDHHPMFWVLSCVFSAIQVFSSYNLQYIVNIWDGTLTTEIVSLSFPILSYINIMLFVIGLVMFFYDIFTVKENIER